MTRVRTPARPFTAPATRPPPDATANTEQHAAPMHPDARSVSWPMTRADLAALLLVFAGAIATRPLASVFQRPYWLDEMWVASLSRAPLSQYLELSSSTPLGWLLLVRGVPGGISGGLRVVPLAFAIATVVLAYVFARTLPWMTVAAARVAGGATAFGLALAPAMLVRNDLKQYTADGFFALTILALVAWVDAAPTRVRRRTLAVVCVAAVPFSTAAAFVAMAAFAALAGTAMVSRRPERWALLRVGAVTGAAIGAYLLVVVLPHANPALREYWDALYLPASPGPLLGMVWHRIAVVAPMASLPGIAFAALVIIGATSIARHGRPAVAFTVALVWLEMVAAGIARRYPFLDLRTSHFLMVMSITIACVGAVSVLHLAARNARPLAAVLAVGLVAAYVVNVSSYYHRWWVPQENLPAAIEYVLAHRDANDVVVVSFPSNYGFDAYWPGRDRTTYRVDPVSMGFVTRRPALDGVVYVEGLDNEHTDRAVRSAIDEARRRDATNVWILRSHFSTEEGIAWHQTFREFGLQPRLARIGYEALWVFAVPPAAEVRQ